MSTPTIGFVFATRVRQSRSRSRPLTVILILIALISLPSSSRDAASLPADAVAQHRAVTPLERMAGGSSGAEVAAAVTHSARRGEREPHAYRWVARATIIGEMDERTPSRVGDFIAGRYRVEELLGRGGMAAVYRVVDQRTGHKLALKRGFSHDPRRAARRGALLEREYHTLVQLAHPRIIEVYEYGIDGDGPYYTMELLEGADLHDSGRISWESACALLYEVASSLAILHARALLHRDVSLRNVRRTPEGRAKLIDFGAMMPMGTAKDVVGTPPFIAPEILQAQELDARADLFSLGAIGYYLLTGRNAYPARRVSELRDVWRSRPAPPARLSPEVPAALSDLILQLLAFDRGARPKSAAEVMERLATIAQLPIDEHVEVSRAYLTTPALVGRDKALLRARRDILALVRRDGNTLLIEGVAGSGRSRMLDACVLEGKLLAVSVARADAADAAEGDWSVARRICAQLIELMPQDAFEASRLSREVLSHVLGDLVAGPIEGTASMLLPERSLLLRELREFVLALAQQQRILIAVDDVDQIDEPSAALLAALAHKSDRGAVLLVLALEREEGPARSASLRLLRLVGRTIALPPLEPEETSILIRSIFGDIPNRELVAGRIHELAQGNPRATMDLARHLVERDLARYRAGSWVLPSKLDDRDLPKTLADELAARLARMQPDARALAEVQAIAGQRPLAIGDYVELAAWSEHKRAYYALDELLAARVFGTEGEGYRFTQRGFVPVVLAGTSDARRREIHRRFADQLARSGADILERAGHLLEAGLDREAIELLHRVDLSARLPPVALLERAIERAEHAGFSRRTLFQLRTALLSKASLVLAADSFRRTLPIVLAQLEHDSGLALYRELEGTPDPERLKLAISGTQRRFDATAESERVYSVIDAIRELAKLSGALCSFSVQLNEIDLLESLPSLAPLATLSPAVSVVEQIVAASQEWMAGRQQLHRQIAQAVLERIAGAGAGGLDEAQHRRSRLGLQYALGLFEAALGTSSAEERAVTLDSDREYRVNAWRIRMLMHLNQGNVDEARKCQRRAEVLQLQESSEQHYLGMGAGSEVSAYAETGDLAGVKSSVETLAALAARYPGWRSMHAYGLCRYRWLQGDLAGALAVLLPAFEYTKPTRHNAWVWLAGAHVRLLGELGRIDEGVAVGRAYVELLARQRLVASDNGLAIGVAEVLAAAGEYEEAVLRIEADIATGVQLGRAGLALGALYETRARIAIRAHDRESFDRASELCANEYKRSHNPGLGARFARLIEDARLQALGPELGPEISELVEPSSSEAEYNTVHSRMLECVDVADRARCALTLLLQATDSNTGYLYGLREGRPVLLAALPDAPVETAIARWVDESVLLQLKSGEMSTADEVDSGSTDATRSEGALRYVDADGRQLEPIYLITSAAESAQLAAVFVLPVTRQHIVPSRRLLEELASELLQHGDVNGLSV